MLRWRLYSCWWCWWPGWWVILCQSWRRWRRSWCQSSPTTCFSTTELVLISSQLREAVKKNVIIFARKKNPKVSENQGFGWSKIKFNFSWQLSKIAKVFGIDYQIRSRFMHQKHHHLMDQDDRRRKKNLYFQVNHLTKSLQPRVWRHIFFDFLLRSNILELC